MLCLYFRINPFGYFRLVIFSTAGGLIIYTVIMTALLAGPCNMSKADTAVCLSNIAIAQSVLNITSDLVLVVIPIPMIHKLQLSLRERVALGGVLGLGSL